MCLLTGPQEGLCVKDTCSTNRVMYTPLLGLWESGRGGRVSSTTRSDAARPRRRGQPTYRAGRQSSALEQEDVIAVLGLPSSRPGGPGLGRWPATTMTGTRPSGRWAPRREPRVPCTCRLNMASAPRRQYQRRSTRPRPTRSPRDPSRQRTCPLRRACTWYFRNRSRGLLLDTAPPRRASSSTGPARCARGLAFAGIPLLVGLPRFCQSVKGAGESRRMTIIVPESEWNALRGERPGGEPPREDARARTRTQSRT